MPCELLCWVCVRTGAQIATELDVCSVAMMR